MAGKGEFDVVIIGGGIVGLWTAMEARHRGLSACVLEVGGRSLDGATEVDPPIVCSERENLGATRARHHVLTGNSAFWGGGLIRNPAASLARICGTESSAGVVRRIEAASAYVEKALGVERSGPEARSKTAQEAGFDLREIVVLKGRRRGIWSAFLRGGEGHGSNFEILTGFRIDGVERGGDGRLRAVSGCAEDGRQRTVAGRYFVVSAGVIDSVLFFLRYLSAFLPEETASRLGTSLHDHWSVPVAEIEWSRDLARRPGLGEFFPPKFTAAGIVGRRLGFDLGFFHLTVDFDRLAPYDRVKNFLAARQAGATGLKALSLAALAMARPVKMLAAGMHYLSHHEMLIPDETPVRLVCDFESSGSAANALHLDGARAVLDWSIRDADQERFRRLLRTHRAGLENLLRTSGAKWRWLCDLETDSALNEHLDHTAIDAYHLGGGLAGPADRDDHRITTETGAVIGVPNTWVMSTASFRVPGVANPVLTLLARAIVMLDDFGTESRVSY